MPRPSKFESHPDRDEILERMKNGESPVHIAGITMERYPADKSKHLDHPSLYRIRKKYFPELAIRSQKHQLKQKKIGAKPPSHSRRDKDEGEEEDIGNRLMRLTGREPPPPEPRRFISDEKLLSWVNGVDGFAKFVEDMVIERGIHIALQDYQREMAQSFMDYTRVAVCAGAQVGKDMMMMAYSVWLAIMNPGSAQLVLCATQTQSVALMDRTLENINMDSELAAAVENVSRKPEYVVYFTNGSRIYYLTARSRIAGKTNILAIWINEARDIQEAEVTRVSPLLGIAGGRLYALSRPRFRRGYFWDLYQECSNNPRFKAMQIPTDRNKFFDK